MSGKKKKRQTLQRIMRKKPAPEVDVSIDEPVTHQTVALRIVAAVEELNDALAKARPLLETLVQLKFEEVDGREHGKLVYRIYQLTNSVEKLEWHVTDRGAKAGRAAWDDVLVAARELVAEAELK